MATDETNAAPKKRGFKKLLIIISIALVVILGAAGAGAYWLFFAPHAVEEEEPVAQRAQPEQQKRAPPPAPPAPPMFVALDTFTVNLAPDDSGERFLQLIISVEVLNEAAGKQVELYTPRIRNHVMKVLSSKTAAQLAPREGKDQLASELRTLMNEILLHGWTTVKPGDTPENAPIREVLFTSLIIQ